MKYPVLLLACVLIACAPYDSQTRRERYYRSQISRYNEFLRRSPDYLLPRVQRAHYYYLLGDMGAARSDLEYVLGRDSLQPVAYHNYAMIWLAEGNTSEAMEYLQRSLALDDESPVGLTKMACLQTTQNNFYEAAEAMQSLSLMYADTTLEARLCQGAFHVLTSEFAQGRVLLDEVLLDDSTQTAAWYYRGLANFGLGDTLDAGRDLDMAISLDASQSYFHTARAVILYSEGKTAEGDEHAQRAEELRAQGKRED